MPIKNQGPLLGPSVIPGVGPRQRKKAFANVYGGDGPYFRNSGDIDTLAPEDLTDPYRLARKGSRGGLTRYLQRGVEDSDAAMFEKKTREYPGSLSPVMKGVRTLLLQAIEGKHRPILIDMLKAGLKKIHGASILFEDIKLIDGLAPNMRTIELSFDLGKGNSEYSTNAIESPTIDWRYIKLNLRNARLTQSGELYQDDQRRIGALIRLIYICGKELK